MFGKLEFATVYMAVSREVFAGCFVKAVRMSYFWFVVPVWMGGTQSGFMVSLNRKVSMHTFCDMFGIVGSIGSH